jgi:copper chaperone
MKTTTLKIQGMTCNHCVMRVTKALRSVPGVREAKVDLQKTEAVVTYDEAQTESNRLSQAVAEAGYQVVSSAGIV